MNKFTLLALILCIFGIAYACDDFNPNTSTIGQCGATQKAGWVPTDNLQVLTPADLDAAELAQHEARMAHILDMGRVAKRKFVASIYHPNGTLMCTGINMGIPNAISHGEIVAINNCTALHGIKYFDDYILYTTGEPCAMCASALLWANFKTIVWGTYNADLLCKICMSNIPMDSSYIFGRYYGLRSTAPRIIGGVLRSEADAFFGSYCSNPNSVYYIKPRCACTNTTSPLVVEQTAYSSWFEGGVMKTQYGGVIRNTASYTITNPTFTTLATDVKPASIWGLVNEANTNNWSLQWYPVINGGAEYSFGYITSGPQLTFQPTA